MNKISLALGICSAALVAASANATDKVFEYDLGASAVATGAFSYATGTTGILGYGDLNAFSVTVAGVTYDLTDVAGLTDYIHFAYDTSANTFVTDPNSCGFAGCGYSSSLSAINSSGTFGFFFTSAPGAFLEYQTNTLGSFDTIKISDTSAVPEPASWALMIGGLGAVGGAMRSRRKASVRFA